MQFGYIELRHGKKKLEFPGLMKLKWSINQDLHAYARLAKSVHDLKESKSEKDKERKEKASIKLNEKFSEIVNSLIREYPEYREYSKDFGYIDHQRTLSLIMQNPGVGEKDAQEVEDYLKG